MIWLGAAGLSVFYVGFLLGATWASRTPGSKRSRTPRR